MCVQGDWMITNLASEDAVLSGLIQYGTEAFIDIDGFVQESTFVNNDNKVIFKCLENAFKKDWMVLCTSENVCKKLMKFEIRDPSTL